MNEIKRIQTVLLNTNAFIFSGVDVYTALAGAVGALYGPLHGGANEVSIITCFFFIIYSMLESSVVMVNYTNEQQESMLSWELILSSSSLMFFTLSDF